MSSDSSPVNSQGVPRLDLNNQTSDSKEDDTTNNDVSSPSIHRGFSSDENSGWTETSEGNFSLSQYPLDDPSCGEDSPQENSFHEEALSSAITEVSKDFISGNFSPGKYPPMESDSSDGDHHIETGAVYARYPESGAGMSDCDWNPYGTDNDNETPRSSASDSDIRRAVPIPSTSSIRKKDIDIRIPTATSSNGYSSNGTVTRDFVRLPTDEGIEEDLDDMQYSKNEFGPIPLDVTEATPKVPVLSDYRNNSAPSRDISSKSDGDQYKTIKEVPIPSSRSLLANIASDTYAMYSPDKESNIEDHLSKQTDRSSTTTSTLLGSGDRMAQRSSNQYIPESHREMYSSSYDRMSTAPDGLKDYTKTTIEEPHERVVTASTSSTSHVPESSHSKSTGGTHLSSAGEYNRENKAPSENNYMPIGDRAKVLGLPEDFLDQPKPSSLSDFAVPRLSDLPLLSRVQIPEKDNGSVSNSRQESMSERVSKLLENASQLGSSLHNHLYSREALGLEGGREPSVLRSYSPMRKSENMTDKSTERSITPGSALLAKSGEMSVRSSLGEEVAKLMASSEEESKQTSTTPNFVDLPLKVSTIPSVDDMNAISAQSYPSLARVTTSGNTGIQSYPSLPTSGATDQAMTYPSLNTGVTGRQPVEGQSYSSLTTAGKQNPYPSLNVGPSISDQISRQTYSSMPVAGVAQGQVGSQMYQSLPITGGGPGSTDSQESGDSLSQRVKKILADTAYVENMRKGQMAAANFDYSRLQKDLQEIQSCLDPGVDYNLRMSNPSPDFSKVSDKSTESSKAHRLVWDHAADLGYDDNLEGGFLGTMKTDTETECESTYSGKGYNGLSDTLELVGRGQKETSDVVSDQVESDMDDGLLTQIVAPDVEEIIRRYQTERFDSDSADSSGLASRVKKILSKEPPRKQAQDILKIAKKEEKEMIQNLAEKPKLDASYDSQTSTDSSFVIQDKDVRKQLEWSQMSGMDKSLSSSYLSGVKSQPFSALGNAKTFLSDQLAKNADRTFNHSIDIRTPYRHVIDCYPVYGAEKTRGAAEVDQFGRSEPDGVKEAWTDDGSSQDGAVALLLGATNSNTANVRPGSREHQRTYSDPRELSPDGGRSESFKVDVAIETEDGHTRSKSEEPRYGSDLPRDRFYNLEPAISMTDRRAASSPQGDSFDKSKPVDVRKKDIPTGTPPSDSSPSSTGQLSPPDSDNSARRREAARLRPYRPHGSRELYYTEDGEDSLAESITTVESNHTGSDDAVGPCFPPHYLGTRKDAPPSAGGIYSSNNQEKKESLSTIDEKSVADDREKSGTDSGVDNASSHGSNLSSYKRDKQDDPRSKLSSHSDDRLALSTRSDPGDQYATPKRSTRYHDNSDPRSDSRVYRENFGLEQQDPKPVKSRSETDLATLPDNDRKYSSPIHGARFMELSTQPSPIYSHHTSMASPGPKGRPVDDKLEEERLHVKPLERGPDFVYRRPIDTYNSESGLLLREEADGVNKDDKPGSTPYNRGYNEKEDDRFPYGKIDRVEKNTDLDSRSQRSNTSDKDQFDSGLPRSNLMPDRGSSIDRLSDTRSRGSSVESGLEKGQNYQQRGRQAASGKDRAFSFLARENRRSPDPESRDIVRPLERGPDFQQEGQERTDKDPRPLDPGPHLDTINPGFRATDRVIESVRDERLLNPEPPRERTSLEIGPNYYDIYRPRAEPTRKLTLQEQKQLLLDDEDGDELEFKEPPKCPDPDFEDMVKEEKAKIQIEYELQRRLKQKGYLQSSIEEKEFGAEYDRVPPNARAKSLQRKLEQESHRELPPNINDLWLKFQEMNPNDSTSTLNSSRMGAITDLLKNPTKHIVQKMADERTYEKAKERRLLEELSGNAKEEQRKDSRSERKRQELQKLRSRMSEEESNGSYAEILEEQKKKKQSQVRHRKENIKPESSVESKQKKDIENKTKGVKKAKMDAPVHGDSIDTLYSIPEDASFEVTPSKVDDSLGKSKKQRQRHVIDPLMSKLKDKIESQRKKIDKERRKEIKRMDKLKKLEMLLTAKRKGKLSDQAIDVELQYVSTTSAAGSSESSTLFGSETTMSADSYENKEPVIDSTTITADSTSVKDSSIEIQKVRTKKIKHGGMLDAYMASIGQSGKQEDSEVSTDDLQVVRRIRSPKQSKSASEKKKSKEKQNFEKMEMEEKERPVRERSRSPKSRKVRDAAVNVPSPIIKSPVTKRKVRDVYVRSEAVQTSPCRSWSPPREEQGVISVALTSPVRREVKPFDSRKQRSFSPGDTSYSSVSPNRSITNRSISPPSRPRTAAMRRRPTRSKSPPQKPRVFLPESDEEVDTRSRIKTPPPPKSKMFTPETPDDDLAGKIKDGPDGGLTWFVPMAESKPWRKPLRERQAFAVSQEPWQPKSVSSATWKDICADNPVNKSIGESTQFDLDTTGHYKDFDEERSDEENFDPKPLSRLTLQEAFQTYKQNAISKLRARQKRLTLASKERNLQEMLEKERNRLFAEEKRRKDANPEAHPLSENLHKPKRRAMSKGEMKELTKKTYKKLPEVQNQKQEAKRQEDYSLNRLRAKVFNRRIQKNCLKKQENRSKRSPSKSIH